MPRVPNHTPVNIVYNFKFGIVFLFAQKSYFLLIFFSYASLFVNHLLKKLLTLDTIPAKTVFPVLFVMFCLIPVTFALYIACFLTDLVALITCLERLYTPRIFFPFAPEPPIAPATPPITVDAIKSFLFYFTPL